MCSRGHEKGGYRSFGTPHRLHAGAALKQEWRRPKQYNNFDICDCQVHKLLISGRLHLNNTTSFWRQTRFSVRIQGRFCWAADDCRCFGMPQDHRNHLSGPILAVRSLQCCCYGQLTDLDEPVMQGRSHTVHAATSGWPVRPALGAVQGSLRYLRRRPRRPSRSRT